MVKNGAKKSVKKMEDAERSDKVDYIHYSKKELKKKKSSIKSQMKTDFRESYNSYRKNQAKKSAFGKRNSLIEKCKSSKLTEHIELKRMFKVEWAKFEAEELDKMIKSYSAK